MGSVQVGEGFVSRHGPQVDHVEAATPLDTPAVSGDQFLHFEVPELASDEAASVSGMREDIVLVSWLIVLWRAREDAQISYDWAYRGWDIDIDHDAATPTCLSTDEIATGMQTKVDEATASISRHLTRVHGGAAGPWPNPASLILSTETTSRSDGDKVSEENHRHLDKPLLLTLISDTQPST